VNFKCIMLWCLVSIISPSIACQQQHTVVAVANTILSRYDAWSNERSARGVVPLQLCGRLGLETRWSIEFMVVVPAQRPDQD
jgi:hypothetical protein